METYPYSKNQTRPVSGGNKLNRSMTGREGFSAALIPVIFGFILMGTIPTYSIALDNHGLAEFLSTSIPYLYVLVGIGLLLRDKLARKTALILSKLHIAVFVLILGLVAFSSTSITVIDSVKGAESIDGLLEFLLSIFVLLWSIATLKILNWVKVKKNFGLKEWE